jgi:hypothetical protein
MDIILRKIFGTLTQERLKVKPRATIPNKVAKIAIALANCHEGG